MNDPLSYAALALIIFSSMTLGWTLAKVCSRTPPRRTNVPVCRDMDADDSPFQIVKSHDQKQK